MNIDEQRTTVFRARKSFKRIWIMIVGFGIFIPFGLALYFGTGDSKALFATAFGGVFALALIFMALAPGSRYAVGRDGILLKKGKSARLVAYHELRGAVALSESQAVDVLNRYLGPAIHSEQSLSLKEWFNSHKAYGNFLRYCSVPVLQETTSKGSRRNIVKFDSRTSGNFVILKLKSGEEFLLSPVDCDGFVAGISSFTWIKDRSSFSSYEAPVSQMTPEKDKRMRKSFRVYAAVTAVALSAFSITIINLRQPGNSPSSLDTGETATAPSDGESAGAPADPIPDTGWVDGDTFRTLITAGMQVPETMGAEEKSKELDRAVAAGWRYGVISGMLGGYLKNSGLNPDEELFAELNAAVEDAIFGIEPEIILRETNAGFTEIAVVLELSSPGLRERTEERLDEVVAAQ